jgi:hypothetical protein
MIRAPRNSNIGTNSIGMSTDLGKLRGRIKRVGLRIMGGVELAAQEIAFISGFNPDDEMKRARLTRRSNAT